MSLPFNDIVREKRRHRAKQELLSAAHTLASNKLLERWCLKGSGTEVWASVQMLREALKEFDKYDN